MHSLKIPYWYQSHWVVETQNRPASTQGSTESRSWWSIFSVISQRCGVHHLEHSTQTDAFLKNYLKSENLCWSWKKTTFEELPQWQNDRIKTKTKPKPKNLWTQRSYEPRSIRQIHSISWDNIKTPTLTREEVKEVFVTVNDGDSSIYEPRKAACYQHSTQPPTVH